MIYHDYHLEIIKTKQNEMIKNAEQMRYAQTLEKKSGTSRMALFVGEILIKAGSYLKRKHCVGNEHVEIC